MMPLLQIAFVCLIYPVLISCYAGQAAFMSKNLHVKDFNHLSQSVPGKLFTLISFLLMVSLSANCISKL
jgi:K+ transporter